MEIDELKQLLHSYVQFFNHLNANKQREFIERANQFLEKTKITAVDQTNIQNLDRALIAASAIIPIFHFPKWSYLNLNEILLYPTSFNPEFQTTGSQRNILGMVGNGALRNTMLLSQEALRRGFGEHATSNTALHEFIHLIDMSDGFVDGIPEILIHQSLIKPWLQELYTSIEAIKDDKLNIRAYAATNEAEFLAVISEYFFQRPEFLKKEKPELYALLEKIYIRDENKS